jgi:PPM family protein phosphatase
MLSYAAKTNLGNQRENNEDCYLACPELCLWVMADGVGGQDAGEVASKIACNVIKSEVAEGRGLVEAVSVAHQTIKQSPKQGIGKEGMATTVVVLLIHGDEYQVAWVGDSRAYLWNGGQLRQLSHDQSLVQRLVDEKIISAAEALHHPRRNLVIQALGQKNLDTVEVETVVGRFNNGDKIILCSDGLTDYVEDKQIAGLLTAYDDNQELVEQLVSAALAAQGKDNITVLAIDMSAKGINSTKQLSVDQVERALKEQRATKYATKYATRPTRKWWWLLPFVIAGAVVGLWIN